MLFAKLVDDQLIASFQLAKLETGVGIGRNEVQTYINGPVVVEPANPYVWPGAIVDNGFDDVGWTGALLFLTHCDLPRIGGRAQ